MGPPRTRRPDRAIVLPDLPLFYAATSRFDSHRRIARFTLPIWFYVSATGVVVFALLRASV